MPLYYFDTTGRDGECRDDEGIVLADPDAAQRYARRALCEIAADCLDSGHITFEVRVRDSSGAEVYRASIALTEPPPRGAAAPSLGQASSTLGEHVFSRRP